MYTWGIKDFHKCWSGSLAKRRLCLEPAGVINCTPLSALSFWVSLFPGTRGYNRGWGLHYMLTGRKGWGGSLGVSFIRALITFMGSLLLWPHHLLKAPPPPTITLGLGFTMWILQGHQHSTQNNHKLYDSIYKKHPEQANPEKWVSGSRQ